MKKCNLLCFHYAGGNKYAFESYAKIMLSHIHLISFELPGRGLRSGEAPLTAMPKMVDDLFNQIKPYLNEPYAFYGHSMGGLLAYLLAKRITEQRLPMPVHLFLSGCGGPSVTRTEPVRYSLPRNEFIGKLREMGGSTDEVLNDESLMNYFLPILRADFQATETYVYEQSKPLPIPMDVMIGTEDSITYEHAVAWAKETTAGATIHKFEGRHFFILKESHAIVSIVATRLSESVQHTTLSN